MKNTNLIGFPCDQVKDWALATRSGGEEDRKREEKERGSRTGEKEKGNLLPISGKNIYISRVILMFLCGPFDSAAF